MLVLMVGQDPKAPETSEELRRQGLLTVIATTEYAATRVIETSDLALAIVFDIAAVSDRMWTVLADRSVPTVVAANGQGSAVPALERLAAVIVPGVASAAEICATCIAILPRHHRKDEPDVLECGPLIVDLNQQSVTVDGIEVEVAPKEFLILRELLLQAGTPVSSEELLRRVWSDRAIVTPEDVHRHVYRLRARIGDHERAEPLLVNRRGFGYHITASVRARRERTTSVGMLATVVGLLQGARVRSRLRQATSRIRWAELDAGAQQMCAVLATLAVVCAGPLRAPSNPSFAYRSEGVMATSVGSVSAVVDAARRASVVPPRDAVAPRSAPPAGVLAGIGVGRDERGISLRHWVSTWAGDEMVEDSGDDAWIACDHPSPLNQAACWAYGRLPQGPNA